MSLEFTRTGSCKKRSGFDNASGLYSERYLEAKWISMTRNNDFGDIVEYKSNKVLTYSKAKVITQTKLHKSGSIRENAPVETSSVLAGTHILRVHNHEGIHNTVRFRETA